MRLTSRSRGRGEEMREERLCKTPSHYCTCLQVMWKIWKKQSEPVENLSLISVGFGSGQWCSLDNSYFLHPSSLASLSNPFLVNSRRVFLVSNYVLLTGAGWPQPFLKREVLPCLVPAWLHLSSDTVVNQLCASSQPSFSWISTTGHLWKTSLPLPLLYPANLYLLEKEISSRICLKVC